MSSAQVRPAYSAPVELSAEVEQKLSKLSDFERMLANSTINKDTGLSYDDLAKFAAFAQD